LAREFYRYSAFPSHSANPVLSQTDESPVVSEPNRSSPQAGALAKEHRIQCHSNETNRTWYAHIAPDSWLIAIDVIEGRNRFNFSDWKNNPDELDEMIGPSRKARYPHSILDFPSQF
jgi:hypothetical protein